MKKNIGYLLIFASIIVLKGELLGKVENVYNLLPCKALIDSVRSITIADTNIENIEGKAFLFAEALVSKKDSSLPYLSETIKDSMNDWKLRFVSVEMLSQISQNDESAEILAKILKNEKEHPYLRGVCAFRLGSMGKKEYFPLLIHNLKDKNIYVRERAIWGLDLLNDPRAIQPLIQCLDDSYYMVQILAIQTLGNLKANESFAPLKRKLDANDIPEYPEIVKHKVVRAITSIGGAEARTILLEIVSDHNYGKLRVIAVEGLENYKDEEVKNKLFSVLNDKDERFQVCVAKVLMKITPLKAKPVIEGILNDTKSEYIKSEIKELLKTY
ncbi:MAG: HEAT repeat domain-containing protein [bacterium]